MWEHSTRATCIVPCLGTLPGATLPLDPAPSNPLSPLLASAMHSYAKEVESKAKAEKDNRIESLRNYYLDQLAMLEEQLAERSRANKLQHKVRALSLVVFFFFFFFFFFFDRVRRCSSPSCRFRRPRPCAAPPKHGCANA